MAGEQNPKTPKPIPRQPGGRTTPVLVPQGALLGQPDVPLDRPVTTFGSNENARLHLVSRTISKGHGIFVNSGGVTYVADLASRTGVLVNGKLIRDIDLKTGDRVQIGKFVFRYRAPANQAPPPPAIMPPAASVIVVGSPAKPIEGRVFQIGRRENSDVSFGNDAAVSNSHAVIFEMDGRWYLRDLGSRTGTTINGKSIHQQVLNFGDRIQIGSSTILFQPGVPAVDEFAEPEVTPDPEDSTAGALPLDLDDEITAPATVADDDAIPLADETPLKGMDWKSAFPPSEPEPEVSPVVPVGKGLTEDLPAAEPATDFAELERLAEEQLTEAETPAVAEVPAEPEPVIEELEPVAEAPAADFGEFSRAEPLGSMLPQPMEAELPVEDVAAVEPPVDADEALPLEEIAVAETPAETDEPLPLAEEPTLASSLEGAADDMAEALALLGTADKVAPIEEPVPVAPVAAEETPVEPPVETAPEPIALADEEPAVEAPVEIAKSGEPPVAAPVPSTSPAVASDQGGFATPVEDFVFVPADEKADAVPEEIFWGDTDLDADAEKAAVTPPVAPPPAAPVAPPAPPVAKVAPARPPKLPVEVIPTLIAELPAKPVVDAVVEHVAVVAHAAIRRPIAEVVSMPQVEAIHTPSPASVVASLALVEAATIEKSTPVVSLPIVEATVTGTAAALHAVVNLPPIVASPAQPQIGHVLTESVIEPIDAEVTSEAVAEPFEVVADEPAISTEELSTEFVKEFEIDDEISLIGDGTIEGIEPLDEPLDPLSDSFPLVAPVEDVAVPADLHAFSAASAASVAVYEPEVSASSAVEASDVDVESVPVAEEFGSDLEAESLPQFVDAVAEPEIETALDEVEIESVEPPELEDLELLEPADETEVAHSTEPVTEVTGFHTVDEIPAEQDITLTEEPVADELPSLESLAADLPAEEVSAVEVEADSHESDLDFLDFTEEPAETPEPAEPIAEAPPVEEQAPTAEPEAAPAAEIPPTPTPAPSPEKPADTAGAGKGPSIFGFNFEGGSFLGGMPISLTGPVPIAPAPAISPAAPVFDAKAKALSGLGQMLTAPPAVEPVRPAARPITPPRPAPRPPGASGAPNSLSGLVAEAHLPWAAPPVIPPTTRDPAAPPATGTGPRKALTSNFTTAATPPRVTEVFSQMSAPIGVEVFGGRPGDPNQFEVPDTKDNEAEKPAETEPSSEPAKVVELPQKKSRWPKLPFLILLTVLIPGILGACIYKFVPVSSQIIGSIAFDGITSQQMVDGTNTHAFFANQASLIHSPEVQRMAQDILANQGQPLGFTSDYDTYTSVVNSQYLNPSANTLEFTYNTTDTVTGKAQVNAVMAALVQKDHDLDTARDLARAAADAAKASVDASTAKLNDIIRQRREMDEKWEDRPDPTIVADAEHEAARLTQMYKDAQKVRTSTETALAELRSQDPTKPVDIEADPQIVDLKKQLQPILDQIARKRTGSVDAGSPTLVGTNVAIGATTQPDDSNPLLLQFLQQEADSLTKKLNTRRADLNAEASVSLDQRLVNQAKAIENLSVKITDLQKAEADAKTAADQATAKANQYHSAVSAAIVAGAHAQDLTTQQTEATAEQTRARNDAEDKEITLAKCITVHVGTDARDQNPAITIIAGTDMRPKLAIGSTVLAWILLGTMILAEYRRPKLMTSARPAAAPRINQPVKLVPWPQPEQLNGLEHEENHEPPVVGEPEQVFGV